MGARWAWTAVCTNLHVYSNFSGGADPCYTCGAEPEVEFGESDVAGAVEEYVRKRKTMSADKIRQEQEIAHMYALASKHGYYVTRWPQ